MKRDNCTRLIKEHLNAEAAVICAMGSSGGSWRRLSPSQPTYFVSDPMGMALPIALGLALAQPSRDIVLIGGDGDFVMSLSALLTVAGAGAKNLKIAVFQNGRYESGGGQPLSASGMFNLALIARGAGFSWVEEASDGADHLFKVWSKANGPALLVCPIDPEPYKYPPVSQWSKGEERAFFMQRLQVG